MRTCCGFDFQIGKSPSNYSFDDLKYWPNAGNSVKESRTTVKSYILYVKLSKIILFVSVYDRILYILEEDLI